MSQLIAQDAFKVIEGRPVTTSRIVAECFGKQHQHVMRDIRALIAQKPELEQSSNFGLLQETVQVGNGGTKKVTIYWMDRKGFSILAMGFTGAKALDFKCAFYDEFERMEKQLHPTVECPAKAQLPAPTLTEQQAYAIMSKVAIRAKRDGAKYQTIYRALKARYQVTKYTNIPRDKFDDAVKFICTVDLRTPEIPAKEPKPEHPSQIADSHKLCEALQRFVYDQRYVFPECFDKFYRFLQMVNSPLAGRFYEWYTSINLISLERELARIGYPVEDLLNFKRTPRPNAIVAQ